MSDGITAYELFILVIIVGVCGELWAPVGIRLTVCCVALLLWRCMMANDSSSYRYGEEFSVTFMLFVRVFISSSLVQMHRSVMVVNAECTCVCVQKIILVLEFVKRYKTNCQLWNYQKEDILFLATNFIRLQLSNIAKTFALFFYIQQS